MPDDLPVLDVEEMPTIDLGESEARPDFAQNPPPVPRPQVNMQESVWAPAGSYTSPEAIIKGRIAAAKAYGGNPTEVPIAYSSDPNDPMPHFTGQETAANKASNAALIGSTLTAPLTGGYGLLTRLGLMGAGAGAGSVGSQLLNKGSVSPQQTAGDITNYGVAPELAGTTLYKTLRTLGASSQYAGQVLQQLKKVGPKSEVPVGNSGKALQEIMAENNAGSSMPQVVRRFLQRVTNPEQGPLTYEEARRFYSNASRLSADESNRLSPNMKRLLGDFREGLHQDILANRAQFGVAEPYQQAVEEYHTAKVVSSRAKTAAKIGGAAVGTAAAGGIGYKLVQALSGSHGR